MAELALISALIHRGGQKAMCDNDCRTTYNTNNTRAVTPTHTACVDTLPKVSTHTLVAR